MFYVILQKNLATDYVRVLSVYEDEKLANQELQDLIDVSDEDTFAYKMETVMNENEVYREGYLAYHNEVNLFDNPYMNDDHNLYETWDKAWIDAAREDR